MSKCQNSLNDEICEGCLSSGRKLLPIKEYFNLYKKLLDDVVCETNIKKTPLMCWECRSILRSVQKFQKQAKEAYKSLVMKSESIDIEIHEHPTLTHLNHHTQYETSVDVVRITYNNKTETGEENVLPECSEVKTEFEYVVEGIKEETDDFDDVKPENEYVDTDSINVEDHSRETDNIDGESSIKEEVKVSEKPNQDDTKKPKLPTKPIKPKQKIIGNMDYHSFRKLCLSVKISQVDRKHFTEAYTQSEEYLNAGFKCEKCIIGFTKRQKYEKHLKVYHSELNTFNCNMCNARFSTKMILMKHRKSHGLKYVCSLCNYEQLYKPLVLGHLSEAHRLAYECYECGLRFREKYKELYKHYNNMHRRYMCDYCGFRGTSKERLVRHIKVNHGENVCRFCNKRYAVYHSMTRHIALRHTKEVSEESYCVECNMQFDNITLYNRHLKTSVKHKPKIVYPCSECPNVYAKKTAMTNHYKYIHLQKTNYYCDKCSRYFLNGFRLRTHIATYHDNVQAPKNKICSYCGRGFVTNRILDNHIRTHTGERPFACSHCTATFAQKSALVTHARAIHKVMLSYATKE